MRKLLTVMILTTLLTACETIKIAAPDYCPDTFSFSEPTKDWLKTAAMHLNPPITLKQDLDDFFRYQCLIRRECYRSEWEALCEPYLED